MSCSINLATGESPGLRSNGVEMLDFGFRGLEFRGFRGFLDG